MPMIQVCWPVWVVTCYRCTGLRYCSATPEGARMLADEHTNRLGRTHVTTVSEPESFQRRRTS